MNFVDVKNNFMRLLNNNIGIFKIHTQKAILMKMKDEWIPEYLNNISKDYTECECCKEFNLNSKYVTEKTIELHENVFIDYPLDTNDFDEIWGDAKYEVTYEVCPNCGHKKVKSKKRLGVSNFYYK